MSSSECVCVAVCRLGPCWGPWGRGWEHMVGPRARIVTGRRRLRVGVPAEEALVSPAVHLASPVLVEGKVARAVGTQGPMWS